MHWINVAAGLFLICIGTSKGQDNFYFISNPTNQDVVEGKRVELNCDVSSRKHITFRWTYNKRILLNTTRRHQEGSKLVITRAIRADDSAAFRCVATNETTGNSKKSTEARINILWMGSTTRVQLISPSAESAIADGVTVELQCVVSGNPLPTVVWWKNRERLFHNQGSTSISDSGRRLVIVSASSSNNGVYMCSATNDAGTEDSDNFILNIPGSNLPHLDKTQFTDSLMVKRNTPARFDCVYSNAALTEWYLGDIKLSNTSRIHVLENGSLYFTSVKKNDGGTYKCVGLGRSNSHQIYTADLYVASLADFSSVSFEPKVVMSLPVVLAAGGQFKSTCFPPKGNPTPTLSWEDHNGIAIRSTSGRIYVDGNSLVITSLIASDTGNFSCVAKNLAAIKKGKVPLIVSVPPKITRGPAKNVEVEELGVVRMSCQVAGTPYPVTRITWYKDGRLIQTTGRYQVNQAQGTLVISNAKTTDAGQYECLVNTTGQPTVKAEPAVLRVRRKLKFAPVPTNTKLELGSTSKLYCNAQAEGSQPTLKWLKNSGILFPPHVSDSNGILLFKGVEETDAGQYTCVARTDREFINATITVGVVVKPEWATVPTNTTAYAGYPVYIHCLAIGKPTPIMSWDRGGQHKYFDNNKRFEIFKNGTLLIREVYQYDQGIYGCTAGNAGGFRRKEMFLYVRDTNMYPGTPAVISTDEDDNMTQTILIATFSAFAYLALVGGLTVFCGIRIMRRRKAARAARNNEGVRAENGVLRPEQQQKLMEVELAVSHSSRSNYTQSQKSSHTKSENTHSNNSNHTPSHRSNSERARSPDPRSDLERQSQVSGMSSPHSHSSQSHKSKRRSYDNLKFPRHDLQTIGMLGKGVYGDVFLAKAFGIRDGEKESMVVVKSLTTSDEALMYEYAQEVEMFSKLNHENIVKLLGVCKDQEPQYMLTDYCEWGDLKQFLLALRKDGGKNVKVPPLSIAQKTSICNQVALGMEHLSNRRFIHKDLAARNILLMPNMTVKVASLGLCKDFYASEYYKYKYRVLPLRWLAPEVVLDDEFSTKTDIWSFGVFLWEVLASGELPYSDKSNEEVLAGLKACTLYPDSLVCPEDLQSLMARCWAESAKERPTFSEVALSLGEMTVDSTV